MKKIVMSALALVAAAGAANAQQLNFRLVAVTQVPANSQAAFAQTSGGAMNTFGSMGPFLNTRAITSASAPSTQGSGTNLVGSVNAQAAANPSGSINLSNGGRIAFVLQAQWTGINGALGLASVGGQVTSNEAAANAAMSRLIESAYSQDNADNGDPATRLVNGTFFPYDKLASLSSYDDPAANGSVDATGGTWGVHDIRGLQTGGSPVALADGAWANIYAFAYTATGGPARDVTFTFADAARYSAPYSGIGAGGQPNPIDTSAFTTNGASYTFHVVPAPASAALLGLGGLVAIRRRRTA